MEKTWFKHSPNGKDMVYGAIEYKPNGKSITDPMEYTLIVYSPIGKGMDFRKIVFRSSNCHDKR